MSPTDSMLKTVLEAYHREHDPSFTPKILGSTVSLLTTLSNPLNVHLLTSQLLRSPAVWSGASEDAGLWLKTISVFNSASITVRKQNEGNDSSLLGYPRPGGGLKVDEWVIAVVKGCDEHSERWQHCLVLAGILLGMESQDARGMSRGMRAKVEGALVMAANTSLAIPTVANIAVVLALNHAFGVLSEDAKRILDHGQLGHVAIEATMGNYGFSMGSFIGSIKTDMRYTRDNKVDWVEKSVGYQHHVKGIQARPLVASMGGLAVLTAYCVDHCPPNHFLFHASVSSLHAFSRSVVDNWRANPLSVIDQSELQARLTPETARVTYPALVTLLKSILFTTVLTLKSFTSRFVAEPYLSIRSPDVAFQQLHALYNLYFITMLIGSGHFKEHDFVFSTSLDMLSQRPASAQQFLHTIFPKQIGSIPYSALNRTLDLFYLNTAEHFPILFTPTQTKTLLLDVALPYTTFPLKSGIHPTPTMAQLFEAAHSCTLAAFAAPNMADLAAKSIPHYASILFTSFPVSLSVRQFRYGFKALIRISTPPSRVAEISPLVAEELLEFMRIRAESASIHPVRRQPLPGQPGTGQPETEAQGEELSEQAACVMALVDSLSCLSPRQLFEWLPLVAEAVNCISDQAMRAKCTQEMWNVMEAGEMDVDRSAACVAWWTTRGGRQQLLHGQRREDLTTMSGALHGGDGMSRL